MNDYVRRVEEAARYLKTRRDAWPRTAVVLGSGMARIADRVTDKDVVDTTGIPGFPDQSTRRRPIRLHVGKFGVSPVVLCDARLHLYEGFSPKEVTFLTRVLGVAGTGTIIHCAAAGGIAAHLNVADVALVLDQINLTGSNPLEGPNHDQWGPRFPDMSHAYSRRLIDAAREADRERSSGRTGDDDPALKEGVYAGVAGPNLETAAEYGMLERIGADIVGMRLVHEVIVARHMEIDVLGLAVITDLCRPDELQVLDFDEAGSALRKAEPRLSGILEWLLSSI